MTASLSSWTERVQEAAQSIRRLQGAKALRPSVGVVLGSGLSALAERAHADVRVSYAEIPHMPPVRVQGHSGELLLGTLGGTRTALLSGRAHLYEGHTAADVVFGVRLLAELGCEVVLLTNAAGGIASTCGPGTLMLISDHLNLTGATPLLGPNERGPRFPDMSVAYDLALRELALAVAGEQKVALQQGIYAGLLGPSYETPAEIRMLELLGASAVGMSTVLEVVALRHLGVRVLGLSCITNHAAGKSLTLLDHREVAAVAGATSATFCSLVETLVGRL